MGDSRYSRNEALFGAEGQRKIRDSSVAIVGLGGLGAPIGQQLAYLGVSDFALIDFDEVTPSSLNRLIGGVPADAEASVAKVEVVRRTIIAINPDATVRTVARELSAPESLLALERANLVFGCLDRDTQRLALTEIVCRLAKPYIDCASDTSGAGEELWYGGRVIVCDGSRCPVCLDELHQRAMARERIQPADRAAHARIYGVGRDALQGTGPSVVSINGVVASLAVTEFMAAVTGLRAPIGRLTYRGDLGIVTKSQEPGAPGCYYCQGLWGKGLQVAACRRRAPRTGTKTSVPSAASRTVAATPCICTGTTKGCRWMARVDLCARRRTSCGSRRKRRRSSRRRSSGPQRRGRCL
jgi:molybdopterin/thiamine biosynthesis adenylyltransferase